MSSNDAPSEKRPDAALKKRDRAARNSKPLTREEKLAQALRDNLKRRKQAAREKKET